MANDHDRTVYPSHFCRDATDNVHPLRPDAGRPDGKHDVAMKDNPAFPLRLVHTHPVARNFLFKQDRQPQARRRARFGDLQMLHREKLLPEKLLRHREKVFAAQKQRGGQQSANRQRDPHWKQEVTARQRGIMGQRLLRWAEATSLNSVLMSFMAHPALRLSGIVVADDGKGFTRHGAWARWLATQYGVLPPLSPALLLPPLPEALEAPRFLPVRQKTARAAGLLLSGAAFILLAASLLSAFWNAHAQIRQTTSLTKNLTAVEPWNVSAQRAALSTLEAQHQRLARCAVSPQLTNWGLSPCARLARKTQAVIERYRDLPYFSSQAPVSLFSSGSARLRAHSPAALAPLLALIRQHPARHFLIIGHSDNTGSTEVNRQLSLERAVAVREWLMKEASLPATQFAIYGLGDSMPVAGNDTETGKALNRRVEVIALPVDPAQNKEIQQ